MFKDYYDRAKTFAVFPNDKTFRYLNLGLVGEAGETADKVKKIIRDTSFDIDDISTWTPEMIHGIILELGDVCWYAIMIVAEMFKSIDYIDDIELKTPEDEWLYFSERFENRKSNLRFHFYNTIPFDIQLIDVISSASQLSYQESDSDKIFAIRIIAIELFFEIELLALKLGTSLSVIFDENIKKLSSRKERNKLHGSGDER